MHEYINLSIVEYTPVLFEQTAAKVKKPWLWANYKQERKEKIMKYSREKEQEYYNEKLMKEEFNRQIKEKSFKTKWPDIFFNAVGIFIGLQICEKIHINSSRISFLGDVIIITLSILCVRAVCFYINKFADKYAESRKHKK